MYIVNGQSMIMCTKTSQKDVSKAIDELEEFNASPKGMKIDPILKLYYKQYEINYSLTINSTKDKIAKKLRLNLYFDPMRRASELLELDIALSLQEETLKNLKICNAIIDSSVVKKDFDYFKVVCDSATRIIKTFEPRKNKIDKARKSSGFFALMTNVIDYDPLETLNAYKLRDEREKYFQQMKDQMVSDRQRNWSEEGKTGRLFILFVSLILSSYVRHIWKST
jgi:hypothetical protein